MSYATSTIEDMKLSAFMAQSGRNTDTCFLPESRIHASCQLIHSHGSNWSVSISLTFDPVTNTPPRTVTVISAVVPLGHLGPASEIGCVGEV